MDKKISIRRNKAEPLNLTFKDNGIFVIEDYDVILRRWNKVYLTKRLAKKLADEILNLLSKQQEGTK